MTFLKITVEGIKVRQKFGLLDFSGDRSQCLYGRDKGQLIFIKAILLECVLGFFYGDVPILVSITGVSDSPTASGGVDVIAHADR